MAKSELIKTIEDINESIEDLVSLSNMANEFDNLTGIDNKVNNISNYIANKFYYLIKVVGDTLRTQSQRNVPTDLLPRREYIEPDDLRKVRSLFERAKTAVDDKYRKVLDDFDDDMEIEIRVKTSAGKEFLDAYKKGE